MRNVRKQMMNGEKPSSCIKCYKEEDGVIGPNVNGRLQVG